MPDRAARPLVRPLPDANAHAHVHAPSSRPRGRQPSRRSVLVIGVVISAILFAVSILLFQGADRRAPASTAATVGVRATPTVDSTGTIAHLPPPTATPRRQVRAGLLKLGTGAAEYRLYPRRDLPPVALRP